LEERIHEEAYTGRRYGYDVWIGRMFDSDANTRNSTTGSPDRLSTNG
jgi:hypothetical protein